MERYKCLHKDVYVRAAKWCGGSIHRAKEFIADHGLWSFWPEQGATDVYLTDGKLTIHPDCYVLENVDRELSTWPASVFDDVYRPAPLRKSLWQRFIDLIERF